MNETSIQVCIYDYSVKRGLQFYKGLRLTACFQVSYVRNQHNLVCRWGYNLSSRIESLICFSNKTSENKRLNKSFWKR